MVTHSMGCLYDISSFRLLKPAVGLISANLLHTGCWVMGMEMVMDMINIWDHRLTYLLHIFRVKYVVVMEAREQKLQEEIVLIFPIWLMLLKEHTSYQLCAVVKVD